MQALVRWVEKFRRRGGTDRIDEAPQRQFEPAPEFGEILAALSVPDLAGVPLEYWPGYRRLSFEDRDEAAPASRCRG